MVSRFSFSLFSSGSALLILALLPVMGCESSRDCIVRDRQALPVASFAHGSRCNAQQLFEEALIKPPFDLPSSRASVLLDDSIDSSVLLLRYENANLSANWMEQAKVAVKMDVPWQESSQYAEPRGWPEVRAHFNKNLKPDWWDLADGESGKQCWIQDQNVTTRQRGLLIFLRGGESGLSSCKGNGSPGPALQIEDIYLFYWNFQHWSISQ